jgi:very-short-patch-repair endonuclease
LSPSPCGRGVGERVRRNDDIQTAIADRHAATCSWHAPRLQDAERKLWQHLRAGCLGGLKFRRQHPVPPYVADFCCIELKLVIELDGGQHTAEADRLRTLRLEAQGCSVLRFWDNDVLSNIESVVEAIWNVASRRTLTPTPLPEGEGL